MEDYFKSQRRKIQTPQRGNRGYNNDDISRLSATPTFVPGGFSNGGRSLRTETKPIDGEADSVSDAKAPEVGVLLRPVVTRQFPSKNSLKPGIAFLVSAMAIAIICVALFGGTAKFNYSNTNINVDFELSR